MDLNEAYQLALGEMTKHGLVAAGWCFDFDKARSRAGVAWLGRKTITLSRSYVHLNDEASVLNTIRHEIAHALTGEGHTTNWFRKCLEIGCNGKVHTDPETVRPVTRYFYECPNCKRQYSAARQWTRIYACKICCRDENQGYYDPRFRLVFHDRRA